MKIPFAWALSLTLLTMASAPVAAQDSAETLEGAWTLTFSSTQGTVNLPVELTPDGTTLRGTSGTALGYRTDFEEGEITSEGFTFEIFVEVEGDWYPVAFEGRLDGEELAGRVDIPDGTRASFRGVRRSEGG